MRIFHDISEIRARIPNPVVTVGSFDGVHTGHRAIIRQLNEAARETGGESVVVTFDPHPRLVLHPEDDSLKLLNSLEEKAYLLERAGVDNLLVIRFTPEFSRLDSEEFARRYLLEGIGAKGIVMGYNHHFGRGRAGDRDFLTGLKQAYDFDIYQLPKFELDGQKVSSTAIRFLLMSNDFATAGELLGEPYFFIGRRGRCGVLEYDEPHKLLPPAGVFPVRVDDGMEPFETHLVILPENRLGLPIPSQSHCQPGQRLIVRFKTPDAFKAV